MAKIAPVRRAAEGSSWRRAVSARRGGRSGLFAFVGSTLYVAVAAIQADGGNGRGAWTAALVALAVALVATRSAPSSHRPNAGEGVQGAPRLGPTSFATWGLALVIASLGGHSAWVDAFAGIGGMI